MVTGFRDSHGQLCLVNSGVCDTEPGESENNIFLSAVHDIEEMFLSNPLNYCVQGAGVADYTSLVHGLIYVSDNDGRSEFFIGSQCFLTNCQLIQEMLAPESTSVEELTTFNVCKGVINWTVILIDLFEVDTSTGAHVTNEGELCINASLPFKNPCLVQRRLEPLFCLHCCL